MISIVRNASAGWLLALLLAFAPASVSQGAPEAKVVAFGLFGDQSVFESEAKGAAQIVANRFGGGPVIVRANTKNREEATTQTPPAPFPTPAQALTLDHNILVLPLSSDGFLPPLAATAP